MESLKELIHQRNKAVAEARAILEKADKEKRGLSKEEEATYERWDNDIDALNDKIAEKRIASGSGRQTAPSQLRGGSEALKVSLRGRDMEFAPGTPEHLRGSDKYAETFAYHLTGGLIGRQHLALQIGKKNKGGYLAPTQMAAGMIKFLDDNVFMRQLATVETIGTAVSLGAVTYDSDPGDADWTTEIRVADMDEDDDTTVGMREFVPHEFTKLLTWSRKLARSVPSFISFLQQRLGYKFAITEEKAYLTGDGAQKPLGIFVASDQGIPTSRDVTSSAATSFTGDDLWDMFFELKTGYQSNATWVASRAWLKRVRKLKDGSGAYIFAPGLNGMPGTVCDRPVVLSEHSPTTFTAGQYVSVLGDFRVGYWICDSLEQEYEDVSLLFTLKNKGGTLARKETDAQPVLAEAFVRQKLGA